MNDRHSRRTFLHRSSAGMAGLAGGSLLTGTAGAASRKPSDIGLATKVEPLFSNFHGDAGIYVQNLETGERYEHNADELFPTASIIKTAIMLTLFDRIVNGELEFHQVLEYTGEFKYMYENEDILASFKEGEKIRLSKLIMLMITISDNSASIWLQHLAGTGTRINSVLEREGFEKFRINSRTPGREEAYEQWGWGQTTPREIATLLVKIRKCEILNRWACETMYRILSRIFWNEEALWQIPPFVQTASKQGALNRSRSEVVLVNAPHGDYVFSIITKNQEDESWEDENEGYTLLRNVSHALWDHFEPDYGWTPVEKIGKLIR